MKESYREGVANHPDPESCEGGRKTALEALTGAQIGRVIELRNLAVEGADAVRRAEGNTAGDDSAISLLALAEAQLRRTGVEEPGHVWKPGALWAGENRETPLPPVAVAVAGLMQVNVRVPAGVAPGSAVAVQMKVSETLSPATITMAVK